MSVASEGVHIGGAHPTLRPMPATPSTALPAGAPSAAGRFTSPPMYNRIERRRLHRDDVAVFQRGQSHRLIHLNRVRQIERDGFPRVAHACGKVALPPAACESPPGTRRSHEADHARSAEASRIPAGHRPGDDHAGRLRREQLHVNHTASPNTAGTYASRMASSTSSSFASAHLHGAPITGIITVPSRSMRHHRRQKWRRLPRGQRHREARRRDRPCTGQIADRRRTPASLRSFATCLGARSLRVAGTGSSTCDDRESCSPPIGRLMANSTTEARSTDAEISVMPTQTR